MKIQLVKLSTLTSSNLKLGLSELKQGNGWQPS